MLTARAARPAGSLHLGAVGVGGSRRDQLGLVNNHPKDQHVLAAAVAGEADTIVTFNLRDFPPESCSPFGIVVMPPDDLFCLCFKHDPEMVNQVLIEQAVDMRDPVMSQADVLANLYQHAPRFVETFVTDFGQPELHRLLRGLRRESGGTSLEASDPAEGT